MIEIRMMCDFKLVHLHMFYYLVYGCVPTNIYILISNNLVSVYRLDGSHN
jgi:hypothetical protein